MTTDRLSAKALWWPGWNTSRNFWT